VKINGSSIVALPPEKAYEVMQDPDVLTRCIPGCEGLEKIGADEYSMKMKMALAAFSGAFDGKVRITEQNPPTSFRMTVEGTGKIGFMRGGGVLTLAPHAEGTEVTYDGDVAVGGTIAAVGQRMIDSTARMMIKRFFEKLAASAEPSEPTG
jgi:uncharacterized protein